MDLTNDLTERAETNCYRRALVYNVGVHAFIVLIEVFKVEI